MSTNNSTSSPFILSFILTIQTFLLSAASRPAGDGGWSAAPNAFQKCMTNCPKSRVPFSTFYSPNINQTAFSVLLNSTAENLRFVSPTVAKPQVIFTPLTEAHVQAAVTCAGLQHLDFRVRSGGHDYEGLSYVSHTGRPFIVIDLSKLRSITVDKSAGTAWVQAGASIGELYYNIAQESRTLGFSAGIYTSLGVGGHITGGGYGSIMRKFGLAVDNVLDAKIVDSKGNIMDRNGMGEDLFWAIRGGGGGSFGIILSWKVRLVPVPEIVTAFTVPVVLEQKGTDIMYKWQQVVDTIDENLFIRVMVQPIPNWNGNKTVITVYQGLFLGDKNSLLQLMRKSFRELELKTKDCVEMSWIQSVMYMAGFNRTLNPDYLLKAKPAFLYAFKAKSDYLLNPIPRGGLEGMWERIMEDDGSPVVIFTPYGGNVRMVDVDTTPYPHRKALCMIQYVARWTDPGTQLKHEDWVRNLFDYMTPFVSKKPREAYANYRDFGIGEYESEGANWSCPALWGRKYFMNNFERLMSVKALVDPLNVFNHELSIPTPWMLHQCTKLVG